MGDDPSYVEDFSEIVLFPSQDVELPKREKKKEQNAYEIHSVESILSDVFEKVFNVKTILCLPTTVSARVLLSHYKWDTQSLIDNYYDTDQDQFFQQANLSNPFKAQLTSITDDSDECKICYSDDTSENLYGLICGHRFCRTCWNRHLTGKIADDSNDAIACPQHNCALLVDDDEVLQLVQDPKVIAKYQRYTSDSFVQTNSLFRWCPAPDCIYAIKKKRTVNGPCACKCGFEFCFECSAEYWHEPVTCDQLKRFVNNRDAESLEWMAKNAKLCPKCETPIEKNGGCNHMTCTARSCHHEFCWVCMDDWRGHQACNRFVESKAIGFIEIARFNHFRDRYVNQLESMRLDGNLYRNVEAKLEQMKDDFSMTNNQVRFLGDAIKVLHKCRQTLTYTFVFAYYLKKNNQVEIFEDNQSNLEEAVERLSGLLEREMTTDNIVELKMNIQESYRYCDQRCNVLKEHINEAKEERLWEMTS